MIYYFSNFFMGTEVGIAFNNPELDFLRDVTQSGQISDFPDFLVSPVSGLIVRNSLSVDIYTSFPFMELEELEASLKMYMRKIDYNQDEFDHATQIFHYLYLHSSEEKKEQYLKCFSDLYNKILNGKFDERLKKHIISFRGIFMQQIQTTSQVKRALEIQ